MHDESVAWAKLMRCASFAADGFFRRMLQSATVSYAFLAYDQHWCNILSTSVRGLRFVFQGDLFLVD